MNAIEIKELKKYYGKSRGVENISLTVEEGDFYGFIGPNGAGKSTTIRTLLGLIKATEGKALVMGHDISGDRKELLSQVGYLPSEAVFYKGMKVRDILMLSANLRRKDCGKEADILCQRLQLDQNRKVEELSLGNRKKVAIVCALQHNPKLYILDEPTGGLDPLMQKEFFRILKEKNRQGATVFLSSHILSEIQKNCNKAAIIKDGCLVAQGRVDELVGTGTKRVTVQGEVDGVTEGLSDIRDLHITKEEGSISFLYGGKIGDLVNHLSQFRLTDLSLREPDLEEIFMHYYEKGGDR